MNQRKLVVLFFLLLIVCGAQLLYYNLDYIKYNVVYKQQEVSLNDVKLKDLLYEDGKFKSVSTDPWIEIIDINKRLNRLIIEADFENRDSILQVFYTTHDSNYYSEENSIVIETMQGVNEYTIELGGIKAKSLRLDITNLNNQRIGINKVVMNPSISIPFTWGAEKIPRNLIGIFFIFMIFFFAYKKQEFLIKYRYPIFGVIFIFLVLFRVHGSSIGMWDRYITQKVDNNISTTLVGSERPIRSDEWLVQTPYMISQVKNAKFMDYSNSSIRSDGQNMVIANTPTYTIETLGKPFYWGYLLFNAEYGLSWYWNSKLILLLLLSFELSMFLTNRNKLISMLGSLWITLSPPVQWWYTTGAGVVELIIFSQAIITCAIYYFKVENTKYKKVLWLPATLSLVGFVFTLYPAVQVPLAYLMMIFVGYLIFKNYRSISIKKDELFIIISCGVFFVLSLILFFKNSYYDIQLVLNTVYPGKRVITGGDYPFKYLQLYLMNWLLPYKDSNFLNNSEVSSVFNLLPVIILSAVILLKRKVENKGLFIVLSLYLLFQVSWLFVDYPTFFAKITLFSYVTEARLAGITLGLTAIYLSIWFVNEVLRLKPFSSIQCVLICVIIFIFYCYSIFTSEMKDYLGILALVGVGCYVGIHLFLLKGWKRSFIVSLVVMILVAGATVNPVARGVDSIFNKKIAEEIRKIDQSDPEQKWVSINSLVNGQYLIALGMDSFNSVHFYPDLEMWGFLDGDKRYNEIYNRYAHIIVNLTQEKTSFELQQADAVLVNLNIYDLLNTDVKYLLSTVSLNEFYQLEELYFEPVDQLYIYKVSEVD